MASNKWRKINNKYILIFVHAIFWLSYTPFIIAAPTCSELVHNLKWRDVEIR
jgi:hypothetical protein